MSDIALVTGASGFVGSAVARALVERGLHVRVLMRPTASRLNIARPALRAGRGRHARRGFDDAPR